ncbi:MAG: glycosyltransferase family 2 protein [bacterium]
MPPTSDILDISVVIPVRDEVENLPALAGELESVLSATSWTWEVLWMDDGSVDGSGEWLDCLAREKPAHQAVHLQPGRGQSMALWVGFQRARGRVIVTLDGDGQNDPRDIPGLVQRVLDGEADMVNGYRRERQDSWKRRIASWIANGFRNRMTGKTVRDVGCSLRAFRRECVAHLPLFQGLHRFLPTLAVDQGFRILEQPVNHRPRQKGTTKYSIHNRLWVGLWDIMGVRWLQKRGFYKFLQDPVRENSPSDKSACR